MTKGLSIFKAIHVRPKAILWTNYIKLDGTCDVKIYVNGGGRRKYISTGLKVKPEDWDEQNNCVKRTHPRSSVYNAVIKRYVREIEDYFLAGKGWLGMKIGSQTGGLIELCLTIIQEVETRKLALAESTLTNYRSTLRRLREYANGSSIDFDEVDMNFYQSFIYFLNEKCGCGTGGVNTHMKIIKRLMNIGLERKLHNNREFKEAGFKRSSRGVAKQIYLTKEEVASMEKLDLSDSPHLERERDRWLVAYSFLMRFSDVYQINKSMTFEKDGTLFLRYLSQKTDTEAILPISNKVRLILEKYNYDFSFSSNQNANRQIKKVAELAGINQPFNDGKKVGPKYLFLKTHTARRSAATNLHLEGCSTNLLANLGGWSSLRQVQEYVKSSAMDNAMIATELEHFK